MEGPHKGTEMAKRTREGYLAELLDVRAKLEDFLQQIGGGNLSYYKEIAIKLRILYCRKSGTNPLLMAIEDLYGFDTLVAVRWNMHEAIDRGLLPASLAEGLVFEQINSVVTWFEGGQLIVRIFEALDRPEVLYSDQRYSYRHIIEIAADKMGGAHVDSTVPQGDLALHSQDLLIGGLPVAQRALFDTARASVQLINAIQGMVSKAERYPFLRPRQQ